MSILVEFTSEYGITEDLHPELPGPGDRIVDFMEDKFGVYTKRSQNERVFPTVVDWRINAPKDEMPVEGSYSVEDVAILNTQYTPIQKQPEPLLCLVGLSRRYFLGDDGYLTFLYDDDQAHVTGEEKIKAAFEEFKKYEDERVSSRCAEMDARLDALSIDFDEELYPHTLTAIAGRRWVIGYGLRLAVMKCVESTKIRQAFANVVSAGLAKGMSEGLKYGLEHGKAGRDLADVEAYDPEANNKLVKTLQDLKELKYPMIDQLEKLKDAPIELIMASLNL
ncbi:hypothetical protein Tco_0251963 [Tanacetum coccineum]